MISDDTLHAVAAVLQVEADAATGKAHHAAELFGPEHAAALLDRAKLLRDYARELLDEATTRGLIKTESEYCPCGKTCLHP